MIGEAYATQQVLRFSGLDFYPKGPGLRELVLAMQSAKSEASARNATDSFLSEITVCPKPAEIRRALFDLSTEKEWIPEENSRGGCGRCGGSGWVHERRLVHVPSYGAEGRWNEYAGRCLCRTSGGLARQ